MTVCVDHSNRSKHGCTPQDGSTSTHWSRVSLTTV
jgi:hypothetical protein